MDAEEKAPEPTLGWTDRLEFYTYARMRTIFLVNPISGRGHLDAYARLYSLALVELGYRVVLIAEADGGTQQFLARNLPTYPDSFSFVSFGHAAEAERAAEQNSVQRTPRAEQHALHRAQLVWRDEGLRGIFARAIVVPTRIALSLTPAPIRASFRRFAHRVLLSLRSFSISRRLLHAFLPEVGRISFRTVSRSFPGARIASALDHIDLVIYLYLDLMGESPRSLAALDTINPEPWVGILFHPRLAAASEAKIEAYFQSRTARGALFLVPPAIDTYRKAASPLEFALVPDVADLELATQPPEIAKTIRERAAGRKVVLQVGTIAPHKGITTLLDVIASADSSAFFFALVGEVQWSSFGADEKRLRAFYAKPPDNVLVHDGYMTEERDYNSLVASCDVIYAVYRDFNSSSNSLTKSAGLRRPILVARDTLMGERVLKSEMGLAATDGDADEILSTLTRLAESPAGTFKFASYLEEHSLDKLKSVLADVLPSWIGGGASTGQGTNFRSHQG